MKDNAGSGLQPPLPVTSPFIPTSALGPSLSDWIHVIYGPLHFRIDVCAQLVQSTLGGRMPPGEICPPF